MLEQLIETTSGAKDGGITLDEELSEILSIDDMDVSSML